jgi:hypothetical protein
VSSIIILVCVVEGLFVFSKLVEKRHEEMKSTCFWSIGYPDVHSGYCARVLLQC